FGRHLQSCPQVGAALLHLVAQLAPAENGEGGIAELLPGSAQPLLQGAYIGIEHLRLVHSAGISKRDRAIIRSDSPAAAYSVARRTAGKTVRHGSRRARSKRLGSKRLGSKRLGSKRLGSKRPGSRGTRAPHDRCIAASWRDLDV